MSRPPSQAASRRRRPPEAEQRAPKASAAARASAEPSRERRQTSAPTTSADQESRLREEARLFALYLSSREPAPDLVARYVEGHRALLVEVPDDRDARALAFAVAHPWAMPFLDAASAILRPHGLLRNKLLLMLAILEASPHAIDLFLAPPTGRVTATLCLAGYALLAGLKLAAGLLLYPLAVWRR